MNIDHDELVNYADSEIHQAVYAQLRDALIDAMVEFRSPLFESTSFLYLDMPACKDRNDALFRINMPAFFCNDVGVTIKKSECIDAKQVQRNCPWTCGTCCIDSPGKMWVDAEVKDCSSLSSYCQDASVQAFCPQTCNICG
jgi:ShK domain-like.